MVLIKVFGVIVVEVLIVGFKVVVGFEVVSFIVDKVGFVVLTVIVLGFIDVVVGL